MKIFAIALILMGSTVYAEDINVDTYGKLFLVEEKAALDGVIDTSLNLGSVVNHSAFNVYYLTIDLNKYLTNFTSVGGDIIVNQVDDRKFFKTVSGVIENDGTVVARYPNFGAHAYFGLTPIKGSLNWLNSSNLSFYMKTKLGAGAVYDIKYKGAYLSLFASLGLDFELSRKWSIHTGIRQQIFFIDANDERSTAIEFGLTRSFY